MGVSNQNKNQETVNITKSETSNETWPNIGPMDSPWPMYSHDVRHTGLSPYSTAQNPLTEKWQFSLPDDNYYGSCIIDSNGNIYIASHYLYALDSNGLEKWECHLGRIDSSPAIDENGIIYIGTRWDLPNNYLYAIYSDNGTQKWAYSVSNDITSSPTIGVDGTIYFGDWNGNIHAVYQNGTRKWMYHTGDVITSSAAISDDGTIYIGSHDDYVYALNPDGTLKWRYQTDSWVHSAPAIGSDGTVFIGSDDTYLYALNPENGTVIWRCQIGYTWCSPTLGPDGMIYLGVWDMRFYAIYPNGTIKWTYLAPGRIWFGSSATISSDGTIFFGTTTQDGGSGAFIALNSDGTKRFEDNYGFYATSPVIGEDGTVYAATFDFFWKFNGYLHAFGTLDLNAPVTPTIAGETHGKIQKTYEYSFTSASPIGNQIYYFVDWGDGTTTDWLGLYSSGETIKLNHSWSDKGDYIIRARAKDTDNKCGPWGTFSITMPFSYDIPFQQLWMKVLERFPHAFSLLRYLFGFS